MRPGIRKKRGQLPIDWPLHGGAIQMRKPTKVIGASKDRLLWDLGCDEGQYLQSREWGTV